MLLNIYCIKHSGSRFMLRYSLKAMPSSNSRGQFIQRCIEGHICSTLGTLVTITLRGHLTDQSVWRLPCNVGRQAANYSIRASAWPILWSATLHALRFWPNAMHRFANNACTTSVRVYTCRILFFPVHLVIRTTYFEQQNTICRFSLMIKWHSWSIRSVVK